MPCKSCDSSVVYVLVGAGVGVAIGKNYYYLILGALAGYLYYAQEA